MAILLGLAVIFGVIGGVMVLGWWLERLADRQNWRAIGSWWDGILAVCCAMIFSILLIVIADAIGKAILNG